MLTSEGTQRPHPKSQVTLPSWTVTGMLESQLLFLQVNHRLQYLINKDLEGAEPSKTHLWLAAPWDRTRGRRRHGMTAAGGREEPLSDFHLDWVARTLHQHLHPCCFFFFLIKAVGLNLLEQTK